ncbi:MAG TPA: HAMP domain-containing sensor histidine kinase [Pseudonocardiaceae bacterium]|nr:HAMP domain-containing sensor histidine kinase [Pseudonocardiaceae bacterium]
MIKPRWPYFGLRTRVAAAVVVVTTIATAVMAFAAYQIQDDRTRQTATTAATRAFQADLGQLEQPLADLSPAYLVAFTEKYLRGTHNAVGWAAFAGPDGGAGVRGNGAFALLDHQDSGLGGNEAVRVDLILQSMFGWPASPASVPAQATELNVLRRADYTVDTSALGPLADAPGSSPNSPVVGIIGNVRTAMVTTSDWRYFVIAGAEPHKGSGVYIAKFYDMSYLDLGLAALRWKLAFISLGVAALGVLAAVYAASRIRRPVRRVADAARQLGGGGFDVRIPVRGRDELAELATTFNAMARQLGDSIAELRAKDQQQQRFVADVAHDLRTPLAVLVATVDRLDDADTPTRSRANQLVATQVRRLARLVEDLLEIARFDAGTAELHTEALDLPALVEDAIGLSVPEADVSLSSTGDLTLNADPRRIHTILVNLLTNAVRHGAEPVLVTLDGTDADVVVIRVADAGPGVLPELLPLLFDRFTRGDRARAVTEGSGLGLAIAKENALVHGGTLTAHNAPGAVFTLTVPRARD